MPIEMSEQTVGGAAAINRMRSVYDTLSNYERNFARRRLSNDAQLQALADWAEEEAKVVYDDFPAHDGAQRYASKVLELVHSVRPSTAV